MHEPAFGQLEFDVPRVQAGVVEDGTDAGETILAVELDRRDIDRDLPDLETGLQPCRRLTAGFAEHPFADRRNQAAIFGATVTPRKDELRYINSY